MKKSCKRCVALEGLTCRLGYPIKIIMEKNHQNMVVYTPAPQVDCPKPLIYDDYHHGKKYIRTD